MKETDFQNKLHYGLNRYLSSEGEGLKSAKKIADGFKKLPSRMKNIPTCRLTVKPAVFCLSDYKKTPYYKTLAKVSSFAKKKLLPYLRYFFIHGSLATMDWGQGFSDLDTYLFIKKSVCENPKLLSKFKQKLSEGRGLLKEIDPNSHHNFLCCNELNLDYYCNAYMPIPIFRHAKILLGRNKIIFNLRDSKKEYEENFFRFVKILGNKNRFGRRNINIFEFKYFVALLLLMPTMYLQAKDRCVYKKFSFQLFKHPFLNKLTLVRKKFGKYPLKKLINILGDDYFEQSAKMLAQMTNDIKKNKYIYINKPKPLSVKIYDKARQEIINHFKEISDVCAIYEYGRVKSPGISDLDLIVITNGGLRHSKPADFIISKDNGFNYALKVAQGTLMVMNKKDFAEISLFDEVYLKKIYGKKIHLNKINPSEIPLREKTSIVDWLPERLTRLVILLQKKQIDAQYTLRYIRSFCFTLNKISKLLRDPYYTKFTKEVDAARKNSLAGKKIDLVRLIERGVYFGYEALDYFTEKFFSQEKGTQGVLSLFPWQKIIFTNQKAILDPDLAIALSKEKLAIVPINAALLPHFFVYSQQKNILSNEMRKVFQVSGAPGIKDKSYQIFLKKKMALAVRCATYLKKNGFKSGLYRFGFFFKP